MQIHATAIPDVLIIEPKVFGDDRGFFFESYNAAQFEKLARTTPAEAAQDIVNAILKNRRRQLIGADAVMIDLVQRFLPESYQRILIAGARRQRARKIE